MLYSTHKGGEIVQMVEIVIDKPVKLKKSIINPYSGFIYCDYDSDLITKIKSLSTRIYLADKRCWEIPYSLIAIVCNKVLKDYTIKLTGTFERSVEKSGSLIPADFTFKTQPYSYQLDGINYGLEHDTWLLGDDQGLGKTKQIIDICTINKERNNAKHCLIICGVNGLKYNWEEEVKIHSNEKSWILGTRYTKKGKKYIGNSDDKLNDLNNLPDNYFIITNIETLRQLAYKKSGKYVFPMVECINNLCKMGEIDAVIFDEAHKSRNPTSLQGRAILALKCKRKIALSGTFLMNTPLDLFVPLKWTNYINSSFYEFKKHYCVLGGYAGTEVLSYKNLDELQSIMSVAMLRRLKTEVLDLPPKVRSTEYVELDKKQAKIYEEVKTALRKDIDKIQLSHNPMSELIRLRQATAWTGILSSTVQVSAKMDRLLELVEEIHMNNEKCIIFSNWSAVTDVIRDKLAKYHPAYITGDVDETTRNVEKVRFQNDKNCEVIIGTIGALGTGFTLTAAQTVIFMDSPWNRALKDQAEDRAYRIGTKGTVSIITLVTKNTIDEAIEEIVYGKGKMADLLIDGKLPQENVGKMLHYILD